MQARSNVTRVALVETAERLFAERGIEAVSLRDVSKDAGQRNHNAAQYHFGDRAGLIAAVYEHRMRVVNDRRHAMLAALEAAGRTADIDALAATIVEPLAAVVAETDGWYGRFLARTQWDPCAHAVLAALPVLSSYAQACDLVRRALGDVPRRLRVERLHEMEALLIGTIAGWEWRRQRGEPTIGLDALQRELTATTTALLTAPITTRTEVP